MTAIENLPFDKPPAANLNTQHTEKYLTCFYTSDFLMPGQIWGNQITLWGSSMIISEIKPTDQKADQEFMK